MPTSSSSINSFTKGLLTEYTGLNFPENAATDCDNVEFTLVGDVTRRLGINYEQGFSAQNVNLNGVAVNSFKWDNAGGDGETQVVVLQVGAILYFYLASNATSSSPLSVHYIPNTNLTVSAFSAAGGVFDATEECQFATGNGYLFVYHPSCDPFYCTYVQGEILGNAINLQTRDFAGAVDSLGVNIRPQTLTAAHEYNLFNQGWTEGNAWQATSATTNQINVASQSYTIVSGLPAIAGDLVSIVYFGPRVFNVNEQAFLNPGQTVMSGSVTSYSGTTMGINVTSAVYQGTIGSSWAIIPRSNGNIDVWLGVTGNYPSNADVWWYYKDDTDVFNPSVTLSNVTASSGNAPSGHFIYNPFFQNRAQVSGLSVTNITTTSRPTNGAWFAGRVWYTGVNGSQPASNDAPYTTWTENIYFSQIVLSVNDIGNCYQVNDPTSENLFDLLPTDGGVITIPGSGNVYKLFPIQNGMLVFAANGVWFITGSQGIGFSANDYTITKLSSVRCISGTSFVDVNGLPYFWNEEGIYAVEPQQGGGLSVNPITVGTILTFYNSIPTQSKLFARAAYDPINYVIQWMYRSTVEVTVTDRYRFDTLLNFNTYNKAFFPYTVNNTVFNTSVMNGIVYVASPGGTNAPDATIKYIASNTLFSSNAVTFAEEYDTSYTDWAVGGGEGVDYTSSFITGYRLAGKSLLQFQPVYIYVYSNNDTPTQYIINGIWDYSNSGNSGRETSQQHVVNAAYNSSVIIRRHKIRGRGMALQLQVQSVPGQPFDIIGWSSLEQINAGI